MADANIGWLLCNLHHNPSGGNAMAGINWRPVEYRYEVGCFGCVVYEGSGEDRWTVQVNVVIDAATHKNLYTNSVQGLEQAFSDAIAALVRLQGV